MAATERLSLVSIGAEKAVGEASLYHTVEEASEVAGGRGEGWGSPLSRAGQEMGGPKWQHSYRYSIIYPYSVGMRSRDCPGFDPPASSDAVESKGAGDEAVLNKVLKKFKKCPPFNHTVYATQCA
jgi:hypothetical protein